MGGFEAFLLYLVCLFILYWLIRLAVRHGIQDAWRGRGENR